MKFVFSALAVAGSLVLFANVGNADPYQDAVPVLEEAGGGTTAVEPFLKLYGPAEMPKAFAVSKDGAFGGRWKESSTHTKVRKEALASCRKKPNYNSANPCVIFMEDDRLVWKP
ncbi:MAG: hypothetical protein HQ495_08265 [Alphaproteobacteria bacterium]|nr:hypothetical protein [Alphaproteobacteria bacterium]